MGNNQAAMIAEVMSSLMGPLVSNPAQPWFWLWDRDDRAVISVNPHNLRNMRSMLSEQFKHDLSTRLGGRKVVLTNSVGIFFQVGYEVKPAHRMAAVKLNLRDQEFPMHVPIGTTKFGPLWISLVDADSVLIGGTRGFGKTMLLHAWIQALLQGQQCKLVLWDGKGGNEFRRYTPAAMIAESPSEALQQIEWEIEERKSAFSQVGARGFVEYSNAHPNQLQWIVLMVDEVAMLDEESAQRLAKVVALGRSYGILPVLATQRTSVQEVSGLLKTNLATRICFPVPSTSDSMVVLGRAGAERLPKTKGRLLINWGARMVEAQAYLVEVGQWATGLPVGRDLFLARRAAEDWDGTLSIPKLRELGWSEWRARTLLNEWSSKGWLVDGGMNTRRLSPGVLQAISQAHKPPQADLKPASSPAQATSS